ncbi:Sulfur carrier protein adenylyltransferase [Hyphomicrobium sp. 1Nfss2.1]|uniref:HesA/MoeB/ThiF family protein n=1 Tax=Hyphomicrobium sp. 1Nfss2.1 TaxID=3413936 RepID=UPI003C7DAC6E
MQDKAPINAPARLTAQEIERYKRHLVLKEVGGPGQQRLKAARVLIIGAGGLGSPIALYLAAAGIGTIGIIDDDRVSLDNLQRQIVHDTPHVGEPKVDSARDSIARLNPHVCVETIEARLTAENAEDIIQRYDIIADGSDNIETRYLVSDACYFAKRTLVFGAVGPFDGYVSTFKPHLKDENGNPYPSYRCLFPEAPPAGTLANCAEVGVLGAVVGVIGTIQATETLKEALGIGTGLAGRLLVYDALSARFETFTVGWDPENPLSGLNPSITELAGSDETHLDTCSVRG